MLLASSFERNGNGIRKCLFAFISLHDEQRTFGN